MPYQASRPHPSSRNPLVYERIWCLVLVKAPCECSTGIIERGLRSRDDNARGAAECVIDS